ncbi:hypothetical protein [Corynebacterium pygosceleis]|uniref:hypothetical protein n=1 Tax=Corynebacterium pygosceleis TaxID=2800406 RepID=UPI002005A49B|nr:hypothetical protein [Corynebacterium pygosceleis]MCK7676391.1 hypothetical protein [Corynebacterium pygosceleis]
MRYRYIVPDNPHEPQTITRPKKLSFYRAATHIADSRGGIHPVSVSRMEWVHNAFFLERSEYTEVVVSGHRYSQPELYRLHTDLITKRGFIAEWKTPEKGTPA